MTINGEMKFNLIKLDKKLSLIFLITYRFHQFTSHGSLKDNITAYTENTLSIIRFSRYYLLWITTSQ